MSSLESESAIDVQAWREALDDITRYVDRGRLTEIPDESVQLLMTLAAKVYSSSRIAGRDIGPLLHDEALTATEVMIVASNILHAANIEIFELAMWQNHA